MRLMCCDFYLFIFLKGVLIPQGGQKQTGSTHPLINWSWWCPRELIGRMLSFSWQLLDDLLGVYLSNLNADHSKYETESPEDEVKVRRMSFRNESETHFVCN